MFGMGQDNIDKDCGECRRILERDRVADSCFEKCYFCPHVKIVLGKRVLNERTISPCVLDKNESKRDNAVNMAERHIEKDKELE